MGQPLHLTPHQACVLGTVTTAAAAAKSLQSCLTLCDPIDGSPPGSPVPGFSRQEHWSGLPLPSPVHETTPTCKYGPISDLPFDQSDEHSPSLG